MDIAIAIVSDSEVNDPISYVKKFPCRSHLETVLLDSTPKNCSRSLSPPSSLLRKLTKRYSYSQATRLVETWSSSSCCTPPNHGLPFCLSPPSLSLPRYSPPQIWKVENSLKSTVMAPYLDLLARKPACNIYVTNCDSDFISQASIEEFGGARWLVYPPQTPSSRNSSRTSPPSLLLPDSILIFQPPPPASSSRLVETRFFLNPIWRNSQIYYEWQCDENMYSRGRLWCLPRTFARFLCGNTRGQFGAYYERRCEMVQRGRHDLI